MLKVLYMQKGDFNTILQMRPLAMLDWLLDNFNTEIPETIVSIEDMKNASAVLLKLSGYYSYLMSLLAYAKVKTRQEKKLSTKDNKESYEDMVDRRDILQNYTDIVKQNYSAVSRAVTIYIENNNELKMGRG